MIQRLVSLLALFSTIVVLLFLMVGLQRVDFGAVTGVFNPKSLAATGFIILAAFSMGEFFKLLKIPALLGYIAAGILFGPNLAPLLPGAPEALFGKSVISDLSLINVLTVGVIGTMGGGELKVADIKGNFKTIFFVILFVFLGVTTLTFGAVLGLAEWAPAIVPFLEDAPMNSRIAAAGLFAVFGMAMSPAATLAILQETRAKGRFTTLVLGVVIVADIVLVLEFLLVFAFDKLLVAPAGFEMGLLVDKLPEIGTEFGFAILIGVATGAIFILYLQFVAREKLLFTVAIIFAAAYAAELFHAETLMAFLTAGFIVQNFSKHGHEMIHSLEKISLPVFVIYFMTQAALLDLQALVGFVWITLILTAIRAFALYGGVKLATRASGASETAQRYLWLCFFSRGGVDLVLAAIVGGGAFAWGAEFQTVIMAVVVVHIILGPPILKLALDWSGETEGSRQRTRQEAEALDQLPSLGEQPGSAAFPIPDFENDGLNARLLELRDHLVELHRETIVEPVKATSDTMRVSLQRVETRLEDAIEQLYSVLAPAEDGADDDQARLEARAAAIDRIHVEFRQTIQDQVDAWEAVEPVAVTAASADRLIDQIQGLERFATTYKIQRDPHLFESDGRSSPALWLLRMLRRTRRFIAGPGMRTIPLGRLWRYYVELSVPRYMARAAAATARSNEGLWENLGVAMRTSDRLFEEVARSLTEPLTVADQAPTPTAEPPVDEASDLPPKNEAEPPPLQRARQVLDAHIEALREHFHTTNDELNRWSSTALDRYTISLRESYDAFLQATARAGTLELPAFRYRPSALFDRSRRAENTMRERLELEQRVVTGHRGWILIDHQVFLFLDWFEVYQRQIVDALHASLLGSGQRQLEQLKARCAEMPEGLEKSEEGEPIIDWMEWLDEQVRPSLRRTRRTFEHVLASFGHGVAARRLLDPLEALVETFSPEVRVLARKPAQGAESAAATTVVVPLRTWFVSELVRETALRFVEFNERVDALLHIAIDSLDDIQQVLEFNLQTAQRDNQGGDHIHANHLAIGGLERAQRLVDQLLKDHLAGVDEINTWLLAETETLAERAAAPFVEHKIVDVQRALERRGQSTLAERGEGWVARLLSRADARLRRVRERWMPLVDEAMEDLRGMLIEEPVEIRNSDIRQRLHPHERAGQGTVPTIYRRLFTPVPLDITDFYVSRPELEASVVTVIREWLDGQPHALLLRGDRGAGKRSIIHHLMDTRIMNDPDFAGVDLHTLHLAEDLSTEADLSAELDPLIYEEPPDSLDVARRYIQTGDRRQIVVIENGEKLYHRTSRGVELSRKFLRLVGETNDRILWIVLMGMPAATWLQTAIGLSDYFTHTLDVEPFGGPGVEQMIQKRHRVSGFDATFDRPRPRVMEWIAHPFRTSENVRDPRGEFFDDLTRLSGGNPLLALLYWLESARLDATDDHLVHVHPLPMVDLSLTPQLSLVKRLILAALIQHGALTTTQLRIVLRRSDEEVETELEHLGRLGFVETTAGRSTTCFQLRPLAEALVTRELRAMNMI